MKKRLLVGLVSGLFLLCLGGMAQATLIDFTSTDWSGINGKTNHTQMVDGISVNVKLIGNSNPLGSKLTWNGSSTESPGPLPPLAGDGDGIGMGDDELQFGERIQVSFLPDVLVNTIYLLDLFSGEKAKYRLDGESWTNNIEGIGGNWGLLEITTGSTDYDSWVRFGTQNNQGSWDYAVAGMDVAPVPEPSTFILLGAGIAGLAFYRRKKNAC